MALSLNTWYRISFPDLGRVARMYVSIADDLGLPLDHLAVELQAPDDLDVEKIRLNSLAGVSFALGSNGAFCHGVASGTVAVRHDPVQRTVTAVSQPIPGLWDWFEELGPNILGFNIFYSCIAAGTTPNPCDPAQPAIADARDDPSSRTVGAFPACFAFPGEKPEGSKPGKKVKVIWMVDV